MWFMRIRIGHISLNFCPRGLAVGDPAVPVVMPTLYLYKEHGRALREEGQMTVVLNHEANGWKIRSWTWTGVKPHQVK